ncbi:hypothetical protein Bbelb_200130 [Branchiostoma belcheri]|nr:hypothetical protein Bbelb_200130 [Branchiostoma belcheri]
MSTLAEKAGIAGLKVNHSARKGMMQALVAAIWIRNLQSVNNYYCGTEDQKKKMCGFNVFSNSRPRPWAREICTDLPEAALSAAEVQEAMDIGSVRIHVERAIGAVVTETVSGRSAPDQVTPRMERVCDGFAEYDYILIPLKSLSLLTEGDSIDEEVLDDFFNLYQSKLTADGL